MIAIDKLCYRSKLRYVNGGEKFMFSMLTLLICMISRSVLIAGLVLGVNGILTVRVAGIPWKTYGRLLLLPLTFLVLGTLTIIVNVSKLPMDAYAVSVGNFFLTGSKESLFWGMQLIITAMAAVSCLYFLSLNTTMTDILEVLARLHCPSLLIELMLLIYRFIFVLLDTASALMTAQRARLGYKDLKTSVMSFGLMASSLFIRALRRSNALFDAMEARCYEGRIKVLSVQHPAKKKEMAAIVAFEILLVAIAIWRDKL